MEIKQLFSQQRLLLFLQRLYLIYLGLLPSLATFALLVVYGHPFPFLVFIGGIVEVSVYLAVVANYVRVPRSLWGCLLVLLDGPGWVLLSLARGGNPLAYLVAGFLVDGLAIWSVILWLSLTTDLISGRERLAPAGFMLFAIVTALSLAWPYLREVVFGDAWRMLLLSLGTLQAIGMHFYVLKRDVVARDPDDSMGFILILLILWLVAMIAGYALSEARHSLVF